MPMFRWESRRFESYTTGEIIVVADTVEAARDKAMARYIFEFGPDCSSSEIEEFTADISADPDTVEVAFIYGSD